MNSYWEKCANVSPVEIARVIVRVVLLRFRFSDNGGDLNGSMQHEARTRLALKTNAGIAW